MGKKIKVLYDYQIFFYQRYGGISRYFSSLISGLKDVHFSLPILFSENKYLKELLGLKVYECPRFLPVGRLTFCGFVNKICLLFTAFRGKYDIFHPTDTMNCSYMFQHKPMVITIHDMIFELMPDQFPEAKNGFVEKMICNKKRLIEKADHIIAISNNTKNDILDVYPHVLSEKITVVHHGCIFEAVEQEIHTHTLIDSEYILYVGGRNGYKNFEKMLKAISSLLLSRSNLKLVCTGSPFNDKEEEFINKLNLKDLVIQILADESTLENLYANAIIFIFPSLYEGFGLPILEAFYYKTPVCLSKTNCFIEVAGDAAIFFDPNNEVDIEKAVKKLLDSPDLRNEMIIKGKERLSFFSMDKMITETENVYKKLLKK